MTPSAHDKEAAIDSYGMILERGSDFIVADVDRLGRGPETPCSETIRQPIASIFARQSFLIRHGDDRYRRCPLEERPGVGHSPCSHAAAVPGDHHMIERTDIFVAQKSKSAARN